MRFSVLTVMALASSGWALYESRPPRVIAVVAPPAPPVFDELPAPPPPTPTHVARAAPPLPRPRPVAPPHVEAPPPPLPPRVATLSGRIVDRDDNRPLSEARVRLVHDGVRMMLMTDEGGRFTVGLMPGDYDVMAFDANHDSVSTNVRLHDGELVDNFVVELPLEKPAVTEGE
jgi:Carboxypeptidase regulatory-like domain